MAKTLKYNASITIGQIINFATTFTTPNFLNLIAS